MHSDSCSGLITARMCILMFVSCLPALSLSSDTIQTLLEDSQIWEDYCHSSRATYNTEKPCEVFSTSLRSHLSICSGCDKCLLLSCILIWTFSCVSLCAAKYKHVSANRQTFRWESAASVSYMTVILNRNGALSLKTRMEIIWTLNLDEYIHCCSLNQILD